MDRSMEKFFKFLQGHHVLCLSTAGSEGAHAAPVFFALRPTPLELIFLSAPHTRHMDEIESDPRVAAGIYEASQGIGQIRGVQLWGRAFIPKDPTPYSKIYFKSFPHARIYHIAHPGHLFGVVKVRKARFIDNRLGFGSKQEFEF